MDLAIAYPCIVSVCIFWRVVSTGKEESAMRIARYLAVPLALACAVLASQPAYADLTGPTSLTLTEGDTSSPQTFTFTNNSGADVTFFAVGVARPGASPDSSDFATPLFATPVSLQKPCTLDLVVT